MHTFFHNWCPLKLYSCSSKSTLQWSKHKYRDYPNVIEKKKPDESRKYLFSSWYKCTSIVNKVNSNRITYEMLMIGRGNFHLSIGRWMSVFICKLIWYYLIALYRSRHLTDWDEQYADETHAPVDDGWRRCHGRDGRYDAHDDVTENVPIKIKIYILRL